MPDSPRGGWRGWLRALPVLQGVLPVEHSRGPVDLLAGVTPVPRGLPGLELPAFGWHDAAALVGPAASMFVVILAQSAATSRAYAAKYSEALTKTPTWSAWAPPTPPPRSPARSGQPAILRGRNNTGDLVQTCRPS